MAFLSLSAAWWKGRFVLGDVKGSPGVILQMCDRGAQVQTFAHYALLFQFKNIAGNEAAKSPAAAYFNLAFFSGCLD